MNELQLANNTSAKARLSFSEDHNCSFVRLEEQNSLQDIQKRSEDGQKPLCNSIKLF